MESIDSDFFDIDAIMNEYHTRDFFGQVDIQAEAVMCGQATSHQLDTDATRIQNHLEFNPLPPQVMMWLDSRLDEVRTEMMSERTHWQRLFNGF